MMLCNGWCMIWVGNFNPTSCIPKSVWNWEPRDLCRIGEGLGHTGICSSSGFLECLTLHCRFGQSWACSWNPGQHGKFGLRRLCWLLPSHSKGFGLRGSPVPAQPCCQSQGISWCRNRVGIAGELPGAQELWIVHPWHFVPCPVVGRRVGILRCIKIQYRSVVYLKCTRSKLQCIIFWDSTAKINQ